MGQQPGFPDDEPSQSIDVGAEQASERVSQRRFEPGLFNLADGEIIEDGNFKWSPEISLSENKKGKISSIALIGVAFLFILSGWILIRFVEYVQDQFQRSERLGLFTLAAFVPGALLFAIIVIREIRSYYRLRSLESLRKEFHDRKISLKESHILARHWIAILGKSLPNAEVILSNLEIRQTVDTVKEYLCEQVDRPLREQTDQYAVAAALQIVAFTAIVPHPFFDGFIAGSRGVMLINKISRLYGFRPSIIVTIALLKNILVTSVAVAGVDLAVDTVLKALLKMPGFSHAAEFFPGASIATIRTLRLAKITAKACSPLSMLK